MSVFEAYAGAAQATDTHARTSALRRPLWMAMVLADLVAAAAAAVVLTRWVHNDEQVHLLDLAVLAWPLLCALTHTYHGATVTLLSLTTTIRRLGVAALVAWSSLALLAALTHHTPSPALVVVGVPTAWMFSVVGRVPARLLATRLPAFRAVRKVLIVADEAAVRAIARRLQGSAMASTVVAGVVPQLSSTNAILGEDAPLLVGMDRVVAAVDLVGADTVFVANAALSPKQVRELAWTLEGRGVEIAVLPGLAEVASHRVTMQISHGMPMVWLHAPRRRGLSIILKHGLDRGLALSLLLLSSPLFLLLAAAVRLSSRGPAIFTQTRVGKGGQAFTMYKFRTMVVDAETRKQALRRANQAQGPLFKLHDDPRVTRVGRFLRKYSLDELPQLINVVKGDMSLVGPRPPLPEEVAAYDDEVRRRMLVRPGLTGLWQVSGRSDLGWDDSVRLDLRYVENVSLGQDADILRRTVRSVLRGDGAY